MSADSNKSSSSSGDDDRNESRSLFGRHLPLERETSWFILVSVLDILLTYKLLSGGNVREANPVARYFIHRWGMYGMVFFKMGMVAFITVLAQVIATRNRNTARWVLIFGIVVVSVVVIYSVTLLLRTRGLY